MEILFTLLTAAAVGFLFYRCKVPGGMLVGAICGTVALSVMTRSAAMPYAAKFAAQAAAGAFIGCSMDREDFRRLKTVYRPALIVVGSFFLLNGLLGLLLRALFSIDLLTALMSCVPGGMSDVPLSASDMGADVSVVVVLQFVRMCVGLCFFPAWIAWLDRRHPRGGDTASAQAAPPEGAAASSPAWKVVLILAAAAASGLVGRWLGIPAGPLIFSLLGVLAVNLLMPVTLPVWIKRLAQVLSGAYIGSSVTPASLLALPGLLLPAVCITAVYMLNALLTGALLAKWFHFSRKEAMLMVTPAGATDMALISADIGVQSPALVVIHIFRMLCAAALFPQIWYVLSR